MSSSHINTISSKYRRRAKTQCEYTFQKAAAANREQFGCSDAGLRLQASDPLQAPGKENTEPNSSYSIVLSNAHEPADQSGRRHSRLASKSNLHANFLFTSASLESCLGRVNQTLIEYYMSVGLLKEGCAKIGNRSLTQTARTSPSASRSTNCGGSCTVASTSKSTRYSVAWPTTNSGTLGRCRK